MKKLIVLASLSMILTACGGSGNIKQDDATPFNTGSTTFEQFVAGYSTTSDKGDAVVYKFSGYSKPMATFHTGTRKARFIKWCVDNDYKFSDNGNMALWKQLNAAYPGETIQREIMCGDGQGGFYGFAVFPDRNATAFLKAGTLNQKVPIDFWPEKGNHKDFWPESKK